METHFKDLLNQHYSFGIFNLPKAKHKCLEPDLLAFE